MKPDTQDQVIETIERAIEQLQDVVKELKKDLIGVERSPAGGGLLSAGGWRSSLARARQLLGYVHHLSNPVTPKKCPAKTQARQQF